MRAFCAVVLLSLLAPLAGANQHAAAAQACALDKIWQCSTWRQWCKAGGWEGWMSKNCATTCRPNGCSVATCGDRVEQCAAWAGWCGDGAWRAWLAAECAGSCGGCENKECEATDCKCLAEARKNELPARLKCEGDFHVRVDPATDKEMSLVKHVWITEANQCATFQYALCECNHMNETSGCPLPLCSVAAPKLDKRGTFESLETSPVVALDAKVATYLHAAPGGSTASYFKQAQAFVDVMLQERGGVVGTCRHVKMTRNTMAVAPPSQTPLEPCSLPFYKVCAWLENGKGWKHSFCDGCPHKPKPPYCGPGAYIKKKWGLTTKYGLLIIPESVRWPDSPTRCSNKNPLVQSWMGFSGLALAKARIKIGTNRDALARTGVSREEVKTSLLPALEKHLGAIRVGAVSSARIALNKFEQDNFLQPEPPLQNGISFYIYRNRIGNVLIIHAAIPEPPSAGRSRRTIKGPIMTDYRYVCDTRHSVYISRAANPSNLRNQTNPGNQVIVEPLVATSIMDTTFTKGSTLSEACRNLRQNDMDVGCLKLRREQLKKKEGAEACATLDIAVRRAVSAFRFFLAGKYEKQGAAGSKAARLGECLHSSSDRAIAWSSCPVPVLGEFGDKVGTQPRDVVDSSTEAVLEAAPCVRVARTRAAAWELCH